MLTQSQARIYTHPLLRSQLKNQVFLAAGTMQIVLLVSVTLAFLALGRNIPYGYTITICINGEGPH